MAGIQGNSGQVRESVISFLLTVASRSLLLRDRLNGRMAERLKGFPFEEERLSLKSEGRWISAVHVRAGANAPTFLICHGIGERVEYWSDVQLLLRERGISSLVFNYTGFGASRGRVRPAHCEQDAIAACAELVRRGAGAIFLLGFSLGTGVAVAIAERVRVEGVILCEGFSSLREAATEAGLPGWLTSVAADLWSTEKTVCRLKVPVLVVHSDGDRLFPLSMAERLVKACGDRGEAIIVNGLEHNAPIFGASEAYWGQSQSGQRTGRTRGGHTGF